jgi:inorganic triphosphatase YgiF
VPPVSAELSATKAAVDHLARHLSLTGDDERGWRNQQQEALTALRHQVGDLGRELQAVTGLVEDATADATGAKQAGARQVAALQSAQSEIADAVAALEDKLRCARARICAARLWPGALFCLSMRCGSTDTTWARPSAEAWVHVAPLLCFSDDPPHVCLQTPDGSV